MWTILKVKETDFYDFSDLPEKVKSGEPLGTWLASKFNGQILDSHLPYFVKESADVDVILGCRDTEAFLKKVNDWNEEIRANAVDAVQRWKKDGCPLDNIESSNPARVALQEADDDFTTLGYHCVVGQYGELCTVLTDDDKTEMLEHPEDFAIVNLAFDFD